MPVYGLDLADGVSDWEGDVGGFDATPVELRVCGSALAQIGKDLRAEMGVLHREMDALFGGGWQGAAADGFAQGYEQWLSGATDVLDALHTMAGLLDVSGRDYQSTDTASADDVTRSGAGL